MKHGVCWMGLFICLSSTGVLGNEAPVWRCGNMYTNQPRADQSCESVTLSTREETQVPQPPRTAAPAAAAISASKAPTPRADSLAQRERDAQAKDILNNELKRLNERCQAETQNPAQQRCAADQAALKRELARLP
jgi:hypothetical protein